MPYYVFAIHTDDYDNRLYGEFESRKGAEEVEADMRAGNNSSDNYFVRMVSADTLKAAEVKADALRPRPKLK